MKKALIQCTLRLKIIFMHICLVANRFYMKNSIIPETYSDWSLVLVREENIWRFMCSNIFKAFAALTPLHMMAVAVMRFDQGILLCDD